MRFAVNMGTLRSCDGRKGCISHEYTEGGGAWDALAGRRLPRQQPKLLNGQLRHHHMTKDFILVRTRSP